MDSPDNKINEQKPGKITPVDLVRAISATVVFGIPLIVGVTAMFLYGISSIYKKMNR